MAIRTRSFHMPKKIEVEQETLSNTYGKFHAEPFERGFGTTIGNALRRVILSSITGAAVTSIKIEGVLHEFSTLSGVKEDITDIILNIKNLRLKIHSEGPKVMHIKKKGLCEVLAKDIIHDADIEILTPDLHIATLDRDGRLDMELVVKVGCGYVPADRNKEEGMEIGVIPIDAIFSPIRRMNFMVENARVGRVTDYDKLTLEVWTDGSLRPEDTLGVGAKILREHLSLFMNFDEEEQPEQSQKDPSDSQNTNLSRGVHEMELSVRAANCLKNANIKTIAELVQRSESEMLETKNFGRKSLNEIKEILHGMGLSLGMEVGSLDEAQTASVGEKDEA